MKTNQKNIKSDLKKVDNHRIKTHEYDDLPKLTDEMMKRATYKVAGVEKTPPQQRGKQK